MLLIFEMWSLGSGPGSSEEALEPVSNPVWQQRGKPLRRHALSLLHGLFHHGGPGLLQHRRPHRTHEWQGLPRRRRPHPKIGQPLCLTSNSLFKLYPSCPTHRNCSMFPWQPGETRLFLEIQRKKKQECKKSVNPDSHPPEGNRHLSVTPTQAL